jgi:mannose-6-phosphate isomerase-like protein (cupin superfamily)
MNAVNVNDLELQEVASVFDPTALTRFNFPVYAATGAASTAVVYFEVEPGKRLATHHDGAEEVLYIAQGEGIATIGDESGPVRAGDLAVIPAWVTHGVENTGDVTLKVVGFFGGATVAHLFVEQLFPGEGRLAILHTADGEAAYVANSLQPAAVA